jgi:hypothetical protein
MFDLRTVFQGFIFSHCVNDLAASGDGTARCWWPLSKAWICGHSLARIAGSNPARGVAICPL